MTVYGGVVEADVEGRQELDSRQLLEHGFVASRGAAAGMVSTLTHKSTRRTRSIM